MSLKPREGKYISVRPNSNAPNTYFIFSFHLQLAAFVKKAAALAWIHQLLNLFDHK